MASMYEGLTPEGLVDKVRAHGLSTKTDDICKAQDIFGHARESTLVELANDPRKSETFYMIVFNIWHWQDATRFYNRHSNQDYERMRAEAKEVATALAAVKEEAEEHQQDCNIWMERCRSSEAAHAETVKELEFYKDGYEYANRQIVELKAKLYDLMVAKEGK